MHETDTGAPPRRLIVIAAVIAVALAVAIALLAMFGPGSESGSPPARLAVPSVPAPQADSPECSALTAALPAELDSKGTTLPRRELAEPAPPATVAWAEPDAQDAIVLRCGLQRPPELTPTAQLRVVSGVQWLPVEGEGRSSWYLVDRNVYVALTVPDWAGTGPLQAISDTVAATLAPAPLRFG